MPKGCRAVLVALCLGVAAVALAAGNSFDGEYVGNRVLTKGPTPQCPAEETVSVTIHDGVLTFTNSALHNYAMAFDLEPDGTFTETHVDVGGDVVDIRGRISGGVLEADVDNPPCEHHWRLKKK